MHAQCPDPTFAEPAGSQPSVAERQAAVGSHFLYQAAIVLATFIFLIGFWSC